MVILCLQMSESSLKLFLSEIAVDGNNSILQKSRRLFEAHISCKGAYIATQGWSNVIIKVGDRLDACECRFCLHSFPLQMSWMKHMFYLIHDRLSGVLMWVDHSERFLNEGRFVFSESNEWSWPFAWVNLQQIAAMSLRQSVRLCCWPIDTNTGQPECI